MHLLLAADPLRRIGVLVAALLACGPAPAADDPPDDARGPKVDLTLSGVAQSINDAGSESGTGGTRSNLRGDLIVTVPGGAIGSARGTAVGHVRFGRGGGVATRPTYTGAVNSVVFDSRPRAECKHAVLAEAYYQLVAPLEADRSSENIHRVELTAGKLDLFGFFDQNDAAANEATQFLNNVFVHNPLLDSGGDIAADDFGFAPAVRFAWFGTAFGQPVGASVGVFAAGAAASLHGSAGKPLVIAQLEFAARRGADDPGGHYRVYAWTNGRTTDLFGAEQRHSGIGLSADQRVGADTTLFGRAGRRTRGDGAFDSAWTVGAEWRGAAWGREDDAIGVALAQLATGSAWRDATADGSLVGYAARGSERLIEVFYRARVHDHLELTPDLQWIRRAGGNAAAPTVRLIGLRANLTF